VCLLAKLAWLLTVTSPLAGQDQAPAATDTSTAVSPGPVVPAFARFARHEAIEQTSAGRLLLSELSCTACHAAPQAPTPKRGPRLAGVGSRVDPAWLRRFLMAPEAVKPGTTMPNCFIGLSEPTREQAATALTAFLSSLQQPFPEIRATGANPVPYEFWKRGRPERGETLFHQIGCVACHEPDPDYEVASIKTSQLEQMLELLSPEELEELGLASAARPVPSVPFPALAEKYSSESLTHFLLAPEKVRPGGRMPDFQLQAVEAADLAAYLRQASAPATATGEDRARDETTNRAGLRQAGRRWFDRLGCAQCHPLQGDPPRATATGLAELDWSAAERCDRPAEGPQPFFPLDAAQRTALQAVTSASASAARLPTEPAQAAHAMLLQRNCFACHARGELGGVGPQRQAFLETVGNVDLGDEGRLPPPLTGVGRKLTAAWIRRVVQGEAAVRPHMRIRMPRFGKPLANALAQPLTKADLPPKETPPPPAKQVFAAAAAVDRARLAEAGRRLLDTGCVQCHPIQGEALPGVVGVDLGEVTQRVQPAWFRDFLRDPASLKPRTRMPTFFPDGQSQDPSILDGEVNLQIAAVWHYLQGSESFPLPEKIREARSQDYELKPTDHPLLLRTFMPQAGTHALAVGFPAGRHYAFDAETNRLATLWSGRFLDAQGTWFVRFAPPADPLGQAIVLPAGFPFRQSPALPNEGAKPAAKAATFRGYRLDEAGIPTLLYRWQGWEVEDRLVPRGEAGFQRRLVLTRVAGEERHDVAGTDRPWFRLHAGQTLQPAGPRGYRDAQGLVVRVPQALAGQAKLLAGKTGAHAKAWWLPVEPPETNKSNDPQPLMIEVEYAW